MGFLDEFKDIKPPEGVSQGRWENFLWNFSILWRVWKETGKLLKDRLKDIEGPDCLDGETILGYVRDHYDQDQRRMREIVNHLKGCLPCTIREMELRREEKGHIPEYIAFIARELDLSTEVVEQAMHRISKERNMPLHTVAGELALACCFGLLPREEILRLAS